MEDVEEGLPPDLPPRKRKRVSWATVIDDGQQRAAPKVDPPSGAFDDEAESQDGSSGTRGNSSTPTGAMKRAREAAASGESEVSDGGGEGPMAAQAGAAGGGTATGGGGGGRTMPDGARAHEAAVGGESGESEGGGPRQRRPRGSKGGKKMTSNQRAAHQRTAQGR